MSRCRPLRAIRGRLRAALILLFASAAQKLPGDPGFEASADLGTLRWEVAARALHLVAERAPALGAQPGEVVVESVRLGAAGGHVRLRRLAGGLPVLGGTLSIHFGRDGGLALVKRRGGEVAGPFPSPSFDPPEAARLARAAAGDAGAEPPVAARLYVAPASGGPRLLYECWVLRSAPPGSSRVLVDAVTGVVVAVEDRRSFFDGEGRVFDPNPVVTLRDGELRDREDAAEAVPESAYSTVALRDLSGGGTPGDPYTLTGPYVTTRGTPDRAQDAAGRFNFDRADPRFEEVMVYYHLDSIQRRLQALGFPDVCRRQVQVFVNSQPPGVPYPAEQSYYEPDGKGTGILAFGTGGVDSAEDAEIIAHEYGHAILDDQVLNFGDSREAVALAEGFCDFFAAAIFSSSSAGYGDACLGDWKATTVRTAAPFCMRRLDNRKRYPYDLTYRDRYLDSEIWSGALWDLALLWGSDAALKLAVEANYFLEVDASFTEAGEALLTADRELSGGARREEIEAVLKTRGLLSPPLGLDGFTVRRLDPEVPVPDDDPFGLESTLEYSQPDTVLSALSLQVYVDIAHPFPPDLTVSLVSPAGTEVPLTPPWRFPTIYGSFDAPPGAGFASLVGESAPGVWRLRVADRVAFEKGALRAWGLRVLNLVRGDATGDGRLDLGDPIAVLHFLFLEGQLGCETRGDANDDGSLDLGDAIYLLFHLFAAGPPPPPPFEAPGADPTPDGLACSSP